MTLPEHLHITDIPTPLPATIEVSAAALVRIRANRAYLETKLQSGETYYGINTGFGSLCNVRVAPDDLAQLQENLVCSHACGMGDEVPQEVVRLMLLLKVHGLSQGFSGVRPELVQRLADFYNLGITPVVYEQGSLGASGDLAPLAHLVLPLLGLGEMRYHNKFTTASEVNRELGFSPIVLQSKEGLALLNGTQFMSAHGVYVMLKTRRLQFVADVIGAFAIEAYNGRIDPFAEEIQAIRPHKGQAETAHNIRKILEGSRHITKEGKAVQDPYSFRCIPQVHGAVKDTIEYAGNVILTEINSVTDNPTIFPEEDKILSGGNFHGEPLAFVLDFAAIALAELGNIAERRVYRLISGQRGLPEFLVAHPGLNSGFMIPQYAAASVVSQNKQLCTPASVDSITSSNEQEDHVSMGANAATKAVKVVNNLEKILAIEMITACQALEFRGINDTSPYIQKVISDYRKSVPFIHEDALMYELIDKSLEFIRNYRFEAVS